MKSKIMTRVIVGVVVIGIFFALMITYQVRFTESAVVETLGKLAVEPTGPGLHMRWPWPIQSVTTYDMRTQHFEGIYEQMQTKDGKNVLVSVYVCWSVGDPMQFRTIIGRKLSDGERLVRQIVRDTTLQVVGTNPMTAFASRREGEVRLEKMEEAILVQARTEAEAQYGIEVQRVGIKRLALPEDVTSVVMENMRSERQKKAEDARSQGEAAAKAIISEADSIAEQVLSFARLKAEEIKAQGSAEAAEYYGRYEEHESFAMFLRRLKYLSETLTDGLFVLDGTQYDLSHGWLRKPPTPKDLETKTPEK